MNDDDDDDDPDKHDEKNVNLKNPQADLNDDDDYHPDKDDDDNFDLENSFDSNDFLCIKIQTNGQISGIHQSQKHQYRHNSEV